MTEHGWRSDRDETRHDPGTHDLYLCPRWLSLLAGSGRAPDMVVGPSTAPLPFYDSSPTSNRRYASAHVLRGLADTDRSLCFAGSLSGHRTDLSGETDGPIATAMAAGFQAAERRADDLGRVLAIPFLTTDSVPPPYPPLAGGPLFDEFEAWLRPPGDSLEDYIEGFASRRRNMIRREIRLFGAAGLGWAVEPLDEVATSVAALVAQHSAKYGVVVDVNDLGGYLERLAGTFEGQALAITARRAGLLVGAAVGIVHGHRLYLRMVGFDYERTRDSYTYFMLTYYAPVQISFDLGITEIHLGVGSLDAKLRRGAVLQPLWTWIHDPTGDIDRFKVRATARVRADQALSLLAGQADGGFAMQLRRAHREWPLLFS